MTRDDAFSLWAARLCLGIVGTLGAVGMYYGNVRFAPIAAGFAIMAGICYGECRGRRVRAAQSFAPRPRPSLTSGDAPRLSSDSSHSLGP